MTDARADAAAASGRVWGVSLAAVLAFCLIAALNASAGEPDWRSIGLTVAVSLIYGAVFVLFVRRVMPRSSGAFVAAAVTIVMVGVMTAVVPSSAVLQFWAFPLLWGLLPSPRLAIPASFALAAAVFAGFAVSTGDERGWFVTALLTEVISFAVSIIMGLWVLSVYAYGRERERLLAELTAAQDELAALHRDAGVTSERARLSRELHDTLAQSLTAAVLLVQRARRELAAGADADETLDLVEESVRDGLGETRLLVAGNAPVELAAGGGIGAALETLAARFRREAGVHVDVDVRLNAPLSREAEAALLRCAQEGFGNIRKHAGARRVTVLLTGDDTGAELRVRNDGRGFDPDADATGFGLAGLRARLRLVGGTLDLDGTDGAVELRARVPREVDA
ncbi:sensor histidine kinase [Microbacterium sp. cx-55]|uniref:sensor histidine kinase n=1 Tax=Microbacterium sp. cx-55 TaxID=2875948 RepID=UPI001CC04F3C|nr:sensor histidine kinase [Microbacterium sp. cx-55]MBZ4488248.1 sensor histidine kinase [Microbacterium sp. cx-55]UGB34908.1 sensor histidine kinase [Microbacterium sp. cx-55]